MTRIAIPISGVIAAEASIVCMASMGVMAGVSPSLMGAMAGMGAADIATTWAPTLTQFLRAVDLGPLMRLSDAVPQPPLAILLLVAVAAARWQVRATRTRQAVALASLVVLASANLCASVYVAVSKDGYLVVPAVLLLASVLMPWVGPCGRTTPRSLPRA